MNMNTEVDSDSKAKQTNSRRNISGVICIFSMCIFLAFDPIPNIKVMQSFNSYFLHHQDPGLILSVIVILNFLRSSQVFRNP